MNVTLPIFLYEISPKFRKELDENWSRELSFHQFEVEKLLKQIEELKEILDESNYALREHNRKVRDDVETLVAEKREIEDEVNEATNYLEDLETRISKLESKRDEMETLVNAEFNKIGKQKLLNLVASESDLDKVLKAVKFKV
jgi:chromosome segregation ATPase